MKRYLPILVLLVCALAFTFTVIELFNLRLEMGDVYPEYSSLRADPLGTMVFYESLQLMPGIAVERNFGRDLRGRETVCFYLAVDAATFEQLPTKEMEQFVASGGRLVMTVAPGSFPKRGAWGVEFENVQSTEPAEAAPDRGLPETLDWPGEMVFRNLDPEWNTVYARTGHPVIVEREFGKGGGRVIIATDSHFLSNKAMATDRHVELLTWLIGPAKSILFDESHFGISDNPGVMALMLRYRLQWFIAGLILVAALYIWKNAMSLLPPRADRLTGNYLTGRDAAAGLDNLLRRNIPADRLLTTCFTEWEKSTAKRGSYSASRTQRAKEAYAAAKDQVAAYQTISGILGRHNK